MNKRKTSGVLVALLLLAVALATSILFDTYILRGLEACRQRAADRVVRKLKRDSLVMYASFDEPVPLNYGTFSPLFTHGTLLVDGARGKARLFSPGEESFATADVVWRKFDEAGSLVFWMNATNVHRHQRIIWQLGRETGFGIVVRDGVISFNTYNNFKENVLVSAPVNDNRYTHVAITSGSGVLSIYIDGKKMGSSSFCGSLPITPHDISIGTDNQTSVCHEPIDLAIDDFAVWRRTLSDSEVSRIATSRKNLGHVFFNSAFSRYEFYDNVYRCIRAYYGTLGALSTLLSTPAKLNTSIPSIVIRMPKGSEKDLRRDFAASIHSGYRISRKTRTATLMHKTGDAPVKVTLDDSFSEDGYVCRPAFIFETSESVLGPGNNVFRCFPPEMYGFIHPEQEFPLPLKPHLVRLELNGDFLGLYVVEPFTSNGSAWQMVGRIRPRHPYMLHLGDPVYVREENHDAALNEYWRVAKLLKSDVNFPWTMAEAQNRIYTFTKNREKREFGPIRYGISEDDVLGDNPAAMYVVRDLRLPSGIPFKSTNKAVLGDDGKVCRPEGGTPVDVSLYVDLPSERRELKFRIMPTSPSLPAVFLYLGGLVEKVHRVDFTCQMIPAHGGEPVWISAIGSRCGAKHRGYGSYEDASKRSLSLAFPISIDCTASRHMVLICGNQDPSKLRNKLSYDIFKAMGCGSDSRHTAPEVGWAEVFVNGRYFGVYETTGRIQDAVPDGDLLFRSRWRFSNVWKEVSANAVDFIGSLESLKTNPYEEFVFINDKIANCSGRDLSDTFAKWFDVGNIIDFFLLLNLTENHDGIFTNHYICEGGSDGKWYLIPWDYDASFRKGMANRSGILGNWLLKSFVSSFGLDVVKERWKELRKSILTDNFFEKWFDDNTKVLSSYMVMEYDLMRPAGLDGNYSEAVQDLKNEVFARLKWMDGNLGE